MTGKNSTAPVDSKGQQGALAPVSHVCWVKKQISQPRSGCFLEEVVVSVLTPANEGLLVFSQCLLREAVLVPCPFPRAGREGSRTSGRWYK